LNFPTGNLPEKVNDLKLDFSQARSYAGQLPAGLRKLNNSSNRKSALSLSANRLDVWQSLWKRGLDPQAISDIEAMPPETSITLVQGLLAQAGNG